MVIIWKKIILNSDFQRNKVGECFEFTYRIIYYVNAQLNIKYVKKQFSNNNRQADA